MKKLFIIFLILLILMAFAVFYLNSETQQNETKDIRTTSNYSRANKNVVSDPTNNINIDKQVIKNKPKSVISKEYSILINDNIDRSIRLTKDQKSRYPIITRKDDLDILSKYMKSHTSDIHVRHYIFQLLRRSKYPELLDDTIDDHLDVCAGAIILTR